MGGTRQGCPQRRLTDADLPGAIVTEEQLATCMALRGATRPDGTVVPDDVKTPFRERACGSADEDAAGR